MKRFVNSKWAIAAITLLALSAQGQFIKGSPAPNVNAVDVNGRPVNLNEIIGEGRDLVILFFFSVQTGEEMALKLGTLDLLYGGQALEVIALGMQEDEAALRHFAERLQIRYFLLESNSVENEPWIGKVDTLPLTLFVVTEDMSIDKILRGGTEAKADLLKEAAETFFQRRQTDKAEAIANKALEAGEDEKAVRELKGHNFVAAGKLDDAEEEFGAIDAKAGLAKVALERGELDQAVELANGAGDGYGQVVKGQALLRQGKLDEAGTALASGAQNAGRDWQKSEAVNGQGRVIHQQGSTDEAIESYRQATALDPYNVVALSNEGAAHREKGSLEEAQGVPERAGKIRNHDIVATMLKQIQKELTEANDIQRGELVRKQINDLTERYAKLKAEGAAEPVDPWTTRPVVLAFLPSRSSTPVFFERAGTDVVLQRELEARLQTDGRCTVVERAMLDQLLQELSLGSSDLANAATQRQLGHVLSASMLGFVDFVQAGAGNDLYLRMVDTETTQIAMQASQTVDENNPTKVVDALIEEILNSLVAGRVLQGLIADAASEDAVMINLGRKHGAEEGQEFTALEDGDPVEVGGRVIATKQRPVAKLVVTNVEDEYAICKVTNKRDGAQLAKEMKIKASE